MATATAPQPRTLKPEMATDKLQTKLVIDGKLVNSVSGKTFKSINPATEDVITEIALGDTADVDLAVKAARRAFDDRRGPWRKMDARDRGKLMYKLADLIEANIDELAALETLDNGKPIAESRNVDLPLVIDCFRYYAGWADKIHGQTIPIRGNFFCYTKKEPVGVAGQIIPWNFPLLMAAWKWGPALACGCTSVLKPASVTALTALRLGELALEAGYPAGVTNVVAGRGSVAGDHLVKHPSVDKIAFTGSTEVGYGLMRLCADTLKRLTFELGGKSPNIIFADADLDVAATGSMLALFFNQGQCCCAGSRVYVQDKAHNEFVDRLRTKVEARKVGDPFDPTTDQGPQVDQTQYNTIMSYIDKGKKEGADCVSGGERLGNRGYYIKPTIFDNVTDNMTIAREEIFGPVLSVLKFSDIDEVIDRAHDSIYGLAAAVWTKDVMKAHYIATHVRAGTVWVNCYDVFDAAAPFGGFRHSGFGRELGEKSLDSYTELKTVTIALS